MLANLLLKMRGLLNHSLSSESDGLAWVLGCPYNLPCEYSDLVDDVRSRIWVSYRSGYFPIRDHNGGCFTSDQGWGCMLRCGQMILAQTFLTRELGRGWRWQKSSDEDPSDTTNHSTDSNSNPNSDGTENGISVPSSPHTRSNAYSPPHKYKEPHILSPRSSSENERYRQVISCFRDAPTSPYSIHAIAYEGVALDKHIGQWFGPTTVAQAIRRLCEHEQLKPLHAHAHAAEEEPVSKPIPLQHTTSIGSDSIGIAIGGKEEGLTIATYIAMDGVVGKDDMDIALYSYIERKQKAHVAATAQRRAKKAKIVLQKDGQRGVSKACRSYNATEPRARSKSREAGEAVQNAKDMGSAGNRDEIYSCGESNEVKHGLRDDWDGLDVTDTDIHNMDTHQQSHAQADRAASKDISTHTEIHYDLKNPADGYSNRHTKAQTNTGLGSAKNRIEDRYKEDIDGEGGYVLAEGVRTPEADRDAGLVEGGLVPVGNVGKDYDVISLDKSLSVNRTLQGMSISEKTDEDTDSDECIDTPVHRHGREGETEDKSRTHEEEQEELDNTPLLLMIPLRLGLDYINTCYIHQLKKVLMMPSSTGFIGGKPNSAYYFIGYKGSDVIFIDPHLTQPTVATQANGRINTESYHCSQINVLPFSSMDPSLCLGFLLNTKAERDGFFSTFELKQRLETTPLFNVVQMANPFAQTSGADTGDVVSGSGSCEDSNSDDFEII